MIYSMSGTEVLAKLLALWDRQSNAYLVVILKNRQHWIKVYGVQGWISIVELYEA